LYLARIHSVTDRQTDDSIMPIVNPTARQYEGLKLSKHASQT